MNKLLASAAAMAALMAASGSAFAQVPPLDFNFDATGPAVCVVPNPVVTPVPVTVNPDGTVAAVALTPIGAFNGAYCTGPAQIRVETTKGSINLGGANSPLAAVPGFANFIPYTGSADWSTVNASVNANNTIAGSFQASGFTGGAANATLNVNYSSPGTTDPLVAGVYSDTLVVQIIPQ